MLDGDDQILRDGAHVTPPMPAERRARDVRVPGEEGVWIIVLGDMSVFGLLFVVYLRDHAGQTDLFDRSQMLLNTALGGINTLVLLTSSLFVVLGVRAIAEGRTRAARQGLTGGIACGLLFVFLKIGEYAAKFGHGITIATNSFFMYYFVLTGIHLLHVLIGLGVLTALRHRAARAGPGDLRLFECGAVFWHMVDVLWIMLFPLLYLVR